MASHIPPLIQVSWDSQVTWPSRVIPGWTAEYPPCPSIPGFPSNLAIPGLSQDGQPYAPPLVQVSRDSQVIWPSRDYPRMDSHIPPLVQVSRDSQVTWPSRGWPGYLRIPGYLDKGVYGCPSWDNPEMARLLVNPGILGQGGAYGYPSWDNPGIVVLCI